MTDNKNGIILNKLNNDLAYYKKILQEIKKQSVTIRNEYEYLKNIYPNLISNSQYIDYYNKYALVTNNLCDIEYKKNNYTEIISSLENLIKQYDNKVEIQLGDYVSIYSDNDESILSEIVKVNDSIYLIDIFILENISKPFNSLEELDYFIKNSKRQCDIYYIDNSKPKALNKDDILNGKYKYLVHDDAMGYEYEVAITYDYEDKCYKIIDVGLNELFYEDYFKSFEDALATLNSDCSLVKKLRI